MFVFVLFDSKKGSFVETTSLTTSVSKNGSFIGVVSSAIVSFSPNICVSTSGVSSSAVEAIFSTASVSAST